MKTKDDYYSREEKKKKGHDILPGHKRECLSCAATRTGRSGSFFTHDYSQRAATKLRLPTDDSQLSFVMCCFFKWQQSPVKCGVHTRLQRFIILNKVKSSLQIIWLIHVHCTLVIHVNKRQFILVWILF